MYYKSRQDEKLHLSDLCIIMALFIAAELSYWRAALVAIVINNRRHRTPHIYHISGPSPSAVFATAPLLNPPLQQSIERFPQRPLDISSKCPVFPAVYLLYIFSVFLHELPSTIQNMKVKCTWCRISEDNPWGTNNTAKCHECANQ